MVSTNRVEGFSPYNWNPEHKPITPKQRRREKARMMKKQKQEQEKGNVDGEDFSRPRFSIYLLNHEANRDLNH